MKSFKILTTAVALSAALAISNASAFSVPSLPEINAFNALASSVCTSVKDISGSQRRIKVEGTVKASFNNWIGWLTGIDGVKVKGEYLDEKNKGVLAKDIALAIKYGVIKGDACKLAVFQSVAAKKPVTID